MTKYRHRLPQLSEEVFLTDGGIETTLIFHEGFDLPHFAAFHLLRNEEGREGLRRYFRTYAGLAVKYGIGCVLESPTWRASADWGEKLGYSEAELAEANRQAIRLLEEIRAELESETSPMVISGCVGPRGDGYDPGMMMSAAAARDYHRAQIRTFRDTAADLVTAITMTYVEEAMGIAGAAAEEGMPVVISFTVETDGRLPTGHSLGEAIEAVDRATGEGPAYYMVNCAHPTHLAGALTGAGPWARRIRGLRVNASSKSHAELNDSAELDEGDPVALGREHRQLFESLPAVSVLGGCCGTDHRHVEQICKARLGRP